MDFHPKKTYKLGPNYATLQLLEKYSVPCLQKEQQTASCQSPKWLQPCSWTKKQAKIWKRQLSSYQQFLNPW